MNKEFKKYIEDLTVVHMFTICDSEDDDETALRKIKLFTFKAMQNYCNFRLKLLKNEKIINVKTQVIEKVINIAIAYAINEYNIDLSTTTVEEYTAKIVPAVVKDVAQLKITLFESLLDYFTDDEGDNET